MGWIGQPFAVAAVLGLHPAIHRVLDIEQGPGVRAAPHRTEGNPQGIGHRMGQTAIGAGRDVEQVKTAGEQERIERFTGGTAGLACQRIVLEEGVASLLVGFEQAPGKQGAHVQLAHPGLLQDRQGELKAQLSLGQSLGLLDEIRLVLERGKALEHGHDPIEGSFHLLVVGLQGRIGLTIREGMEPHRCRPSQASASEGQGGLARAGAAGATAGSRRSQGAIGSGRATGGHQGFSRELRRRR